MSWSTISSAIFDHVSLPANDGRAVAPPLAGRRLSPPLPMCRDMGVAACVAELDLIRGFQPNGVRIAAFTAMGAFDLTHVISFSVQAALANHARMRSGRGVSIDRASASRWRVRACSARCARLVAVSTG